MTTEDFIKNVAHDLFSGGVTLTPIAEAKAIPCNIIPKPAWINTVFCWKRNAYTVRKKL